MNTTAIEALQARLDLASDAPAIVFGENTFSCGDIASAASELEGVLSGAGVAANRSIAFVARNRPAHVAALFGLLASARSLAMVYSAQSAEALATNLLKIRPAAVVLDADDAAPAVLAAARDLGALVVTCGAGLSFGVAAPYRPDASHRQTAEAGVVEVLSSGTTGPPKLVAITPAMFERLVATMRVADTDQASVVIIVWPIGSLAGFCSIIGSFVIGRVNVVLEKFTVEGWVRAVRRHRPTVVSGPPAILRMVLDAKVPPEALGSVRYYFGGSAHLDVGLQDAFEEAYGIPILWSYGATEFCGGVVAWTLDAYRQYRVLKAGAMGQIMPGVSIRAVSPETGEPVEFGQVGYLEALVPSVSETWIATTDLVTIDADGFVFHKGRGDGAIVRGGFKIMPETVAEALRTHPGVRDVAVVALPDERLGQIPVAAIEPRAGPSWPTPEDLERHVRRTLPAHQVPARFLILDSLPRTQTLKVDLAALQALFAAQAAV